MSAIDLKKTKHKAESILESSNKQFVSQSEKDKWNNCNGNENVVVDLSNYYTKSEVNEEISKIKALMVGVKFNINSLDWVAKDSLFKYSLVHDFDLPIECISLTFYNSTNQNLLLDYTYIDRNTIEVFTDKKEDIVLVIKQVVETNNKVDLSNYYNKQETDSNIQTKIDELVDAAPEALDTLKELSDALGNDANFSTTITNLIAEKAPKAHTHNLTLTETDLGIVGKNIDMQFVENIRIKLLQSGAMYNSEKSILICTDNTGCYLGMCGWYSDGNGYNAGFYKSTYYLNQFTTGTTWHLITPTWGHGLIVKYDKNKKFIGFKTLVHGNWTTRLRELNKEGYYPSDKEGIDILFIDNPIVAHTLPGYADFQMVHDTSINKIDKGHITFQHAKATDEILNSFVGKSGEIIMNTNSKSIHIMDGDIPGGIPLATKKEVEQLFQSVSSGKNKLETVITDKGSEVSKENEVATFNELGIAINNINSEDLIGKQKMLDVLLSKVPSLDGVITLESPLSLYAHYMMMIGPMNLVFRDNIDTKIKNVLHKTSVMNIKDFNTSFNTITRLEKNNLINETYHKLQINKMLPKTFNIKSMGDNMKGELE